MKDNIKQTMYDVEKLAVKLKKKIKRNDLDFSVQVSLSTADPGQIYYALQITPVADGVAPMSFIKKSPEELLEAVKAQLENIDSVAVEKAYHEAQVKHAERTITFHKERVDELNNEEQASAESKE